MAEQPCIQCGECATACPHGLYPQLVLALLRRDDSEGAQGLGLDACIACGRCDAVCPSRIPLSERFRVAHAGIQEERARHAFAMASRERHLARAARLERERHEQSEVRQSKRANHAAAAAVAAALERARNRHKPTDPPPCP